MTKSIYSTAFNIIKYNFDYKDALNNWFYYADEVCIAVNTSEDNTFDALHDYAVEKNYNLKLVKTEFSYDDPFCYGKIENSALQKCSGEILIQQNLDERFYADKVVLDNLLDKFVQNESVKALFVPTIDLYENNLKYINLGKKWYIHKRGLNRGPVTFGIKDSGRPDYNKTSTDELIDERGNLVPTIDLIPNLNIDNLRQYVNMGNPVSYHLGYVSLKDRLDRAKWWKSFWENATGGDQNSHPTSMKELLDRKCQYHDLPLWETL